jgi:hypothetical protein
MAEPFTYHDDGGEDLEPAAREVACRYFLDAGPQHTEFVTQFLGPSECGKFDVLWEESDWTEDVTVAVAWMPRGKLHGFELWQALALAFWNVRRKASIGKTQAVSKSSTGRTPWWMPTPFGPF